MKIKILGTRGEIKESAPYHSRHSGLLVDGKILFDLGEPEFLDCRPRAVFFTHLHPDHAYFIRPEEKEPETRAALFGPERHEDGLDVKVLRKKKRIGPYGVTPVPTVHGKKARSQAYLIEKGGQKALYTGDMIWINKKYHNMLKGLDLVVTEASFFRRGGMVRRDKDTGEIFGHNGVPDLVDLFRRFTDNIALMHFGSWFYKDMKKARRKICTLAREKGARIIVGYDGLEMEI